MTLRSVLAAALLLFSCSKAQPPSFKTAKISRGEVASVISATGTLQPEEVVDIGAQVTGQILKFGEDTEGKAIDYGSKVVAGQVLASIDDQVYRINRQQAEAQLAQARANLKAAAASLMQAQANVLQTQARKEQAQAQLAQAERDWNRAKKLGPSESLAQAAFDAYLGAFESAQANVKAVGSSIQVAQAQVASAEAAGLQAQAQIASAEAAIALSERNLGYCSIKSPVTGIVIDRRVDVGQTVVSNLSASSLFLLAKDLEKMELWVAVNEADIGSIHVGQGVSYSVDAFPGETYKGKVGKVRLNAAMTQNVVSYTVEIVTDNPGGKLLPYLSAKVSFEIARKSDVQLVPNGALRWTPDAAQIVAEAEPASAENAEPAGKMPTNPVENGDKRKGGGKAKTNGHLWVRVPGEEVRFRSVPVRTGLSDGIITEVSPLRPEDKLEELEITIGEERPDVAPASENPFAPKMPGRGTRKVM